MISRLPPQRPLRLVFCTTPSVYSDAVLQVLMQSPHLELVGIVASTRILRKKGWSGWDAVRLLRKTGLRYATYLWTVTTLYSLLHGLMADAQIQQVPTHATRDINSSNSLAFVKNLQPDLLLSAHFNQLIGPELLGLPLQGSLNIHPGRLPEYKGVDPVIRALDKAESQVGVTLHRQDEGFDTGAVLAKAGRSVAASDTLLSLNLCLFQQGAELLRDLLADSAALPAGEPQQPDLRYDSWPDAALVKRLRRSGRRLLDGRLWWASLRRSL